MKTLIISLLTAILFLGLSPVSPKITTPPSEIDTYNCKYYFTYKEEDDSLRHACCDTVYVGKYFLHCLNKDMRVTKSVELWRVNTFRAKQEQPVFIGHIK